MRRFLACFLMLTGAIGLTGQATAVSDRAQAFRKANALNEAVVPKTFLEGAFVANEINPRYVFGSVNDLLKACPCPSSWLMDDEERRRIGDEEKRTAPLEYTVYLEADCPDHLSYFVFVVQQSSDPEQWLKWRRQFHKSKAEPQYGQTKDRLQQALEGGLHLNGELRFLIVDQELDTSNPEEVMIRDFKLVPAYDLEKGMKTAQ